MRLSVRNKSANVDFLPYSQTYYQINSPNNSSHTNNSNSSLSSHLLANNQSSKLQNSLAKNFIDYNLPQQQQQQQQQTQNNILHRVTSGRVHSSNGQYPHVNHQHSNNLKLLNDSSKFLEDILANSKRSLKQTGALNTLSLTPSASNSNLASSSQLPSTASSSVNSSIQLPANLTVVNRTSDERALFPDKLILER